ncbi:hypothetical protein HMI50_04920 [Corallococcus carmarthensis]|nr:hypothetical protein [Corallococcus carmarthensis]
MARLEVATLALLPRSGGEAEGFVQLEPTLILDGGPEFGLNLGAPVRLRAWDRAGRVRREDWDHLSDWGQLVRGLKLGSDAAPVGVWLGALEDYSLLSAHLVRRYSNQTNPDYHPAGGFLTGTVGPLYTEAFASDVLGARLMGAEVALDVGRVLFGAGHSPGRYSLAVSAVHDWGRARGSAPSVTLARLDADGRLAVQVLERNLEVAVKGLGVGLGRPGARYLGAAEARWRIVEGKRYAVATGGTLLFLDVDGALRPGAFASVGLGADNAR